MSSQTTTTEAASGAEGFVLVPREPTEEMIFADIGLRPSNHRYDAIASKSAHSYKLMIAAAPVTGTEGERFWLPMKDAPTGVPIIAKHRPNARMPLGWIGTVTLGHGDEKEPGALDTILHYNGDALIWNFHGCWEGWLPFGSAIPTTAPQPAGAERVDLAELERLRQAAQSRYELLRECQAEFKALGSKGLVETIETVLGRGEGTAGADVLAERRRQIEAEGWTPEHDDEHQDGEMAAAAACYAGYADMAPTFNRAKPPVLWPWDPMWWKPTDRRRDLVKAGALILAEIERLDRATLTASQEQDGGDR